MPEREEGRIRGRAACMEAERARQVRPGLAFWIVRFSGFLRSRGFNVFQSGVQDALRSVVITGVGRREDFKAALRANLTSAELEWHRFDELFREFWGACKSPAVEDSSPAPNREDFPNPDKLLPLSPIVEMNPEDGSRAAVELCSEGVGYSPLSGLDRKDLGRFDAADIRTASLALRKMAEPFRLEAGFRKRRAAGKTETLDIPRTLREGLKTGGTLLKLFYRVKRRRLKRLVVIADVSGSMERYSEVVMPFILGLKSVGSRAEVFVFSTTLTPVTFYVRRLPFKHALARITAETPDWSGGTRIGYCLRRFNRDHGHRLLNRRTVAVILSDGWDLGSKEMLRREMALLNEKVHSVIWLNPVEGENDRRPMAGGMKTALPYIDHYMSARSLESLSRVGRLLARVVFR